jgi:hypothetical protein
MARCLQRWWAERIEMQSTQFRFPSDAKGGTMKRILALSVAALLCLSVAAYAGGDKTKGGHKSATIVSVDNTSKSMVVKNAEGKEWTIYWNDSTKLEGGEVKAGEMIHFKADKDKDGKAWASWIHVGEMKKM